MKYTATFTVTVELDPAAIELEGKRRGRPFDVTQQEVIGDLECRIHDAIRHRNSVTRVGVVVEEQLTGAVR